MLLCVVSLRSTSLWLIMENVKRCDNCVFSVWVIGIDRPILSCMQQAGFVGKRRSHRLSDECNNFYPTTDSKLSLTIPRPPRPIPLTRGKFALVDANDYYWLTKYKWISLSNANTSYASSRVKGKITKMHRLITNAPADLIVDHIDHDGLNNRRSNLRLCTPAQNARNAAPNKGTTSKYKGVHKSKGAKKWGATIQYNKKIYHLGTFENEIDAAKAYDAKAPELFGEFAHLNFPVFVEKLRQDNKIKKTDIKSR